MINFSIKLFNAIGIILIIMSTSYITLMIADLVVAEYNSIITFIGGGATAIIASSLIGTIFKER